MNHSLSSALVSMQSMQKKLDIISNNIANLNTAGYKSQQASFQDVLTSVYQQPETFGREGRLTPLGFTQGGGVKLGVVSTDMTQGSLQETGNELDLAIQGDGLFEIERDSAANGGNPIVGWTRGGAFQLSPNPADEQFLFLTTKQGQFVRGVNNLPIMVPRDRSIRIDEDGTVWSVNPADSSDIQEAGQLKLVRVNRPDVLLQEGEGIYALPEGVNAEEVFTLNAPLAQGGFPVTVRQGFLEQSNVNITEEMTQLIAVQRAYQLTARAISSSDTMMSLTNNLRA